MKTILTLITFLLISCGGGNDPSMPQQVQQAAAVEPAVQQNQSPPQVAPKEHEPVERHQYLSRATEKPNGK